MEGKVRVATVRGSVYEIDDLVNERLQSLGNPYVIDIKFNVTENGIVATMYAMIVYRENI